jgi:hypothetical protein
LPVCRFSAVFAGMIAASAIGLFVIPMLYVTFQTIRERSSARLRRQEPHLRRPRPRLVGRTRVVAGDR